MPFQDDQPVVGPLALPEGFDIHPDVEAPKGSVIGAAFRLENPIVSALSGYQYDESVEYDPDYRISDDIQGSKYEMYADRFVDARNADQAAMMKAQIDRELDDRAVLDAAGGWGFMAQMGAGILSPTSLLPGGAIIKGANGVRIGKSALSVSGATGVAVALDEFVLQGTQQTRTGEESALAIGGSMIVGGMLGGGVAHLTRNAHVRASKGAEAAPEFVQGFNDHLRSIGAAENTSDFTLRREGLFQFFNSAQFKIDDALSKVLPDRIASTVSKVAAPMRILVRSDPILRTMLSENKAVRAYLPDLVETPLQYKANETGQVVGNYGMSAETAIKTRRNTELVESIGHLQKQYADYVNDGTAGVIGRVSAPIKGRFQHLLGYDRKLTQTQFLEETGRALMSSDSHPIPQVQKAAEQLRANIFNRIKQDAIDVGIFDEGLQLKYAESYFMRVYNTEKIEAHMGSGSADDFKVILKSEFMRKRSEAENRLAQDDTVRQLENQKFNASERARTAQGALNKAEKKAKDKRGRADAAIKREGAVGRVTGSLSKAFAKRSTGLEKGILQGEQLESFKAMLSDARGLNRLEPTDILDQIRAMGGMKDDGSGELAAALDTKARTIKRADAMHPDDVRGQLEELGYLEEGSTTNDMYTAMRESADGNKIYSSFDRQEIARFEAAKEFAEAMSERGIDISGKVDEILKKIEGQSRSPKVTKAKAGEAARSSRKSGEKAVSADARILKAIDRLEDANARLAELDEIVGPKVRNEIKDAQAELKKILPELHDAKKAQSSDEYFASTTDLDIESSVDDAVNSILGLNPGEHSTRASLSSPTRARTLDISDDLLAPWLETDASKIMSQYFDSMVPDIEIRRRFGDLELTEAKRKIIDEKDRLVGKSKTERERKRHSREAELRIKDLDAMLGRMRGTFGVPDDPKDIATRGFRAARSLSYMGYLGGMTLSAIPDVAGVIGRNGIEAAFGSMDAVMNPKRFGVALKDQADIGGAAEWFLNSRAVAISEVMDPYGQHSSFERMLGQGTKAFGTVTGMVPWNAAWKSIGGAVSSSKMSKAAVAVVEGNATKKQLLALSENRIDSGLAQKIGKQVLAHADRDGGMWLPKAKLWDDPVAYEAFVGAMNREMDLIVITPGQDKPVWWSSETGKFLTQFKSFGVSAHHRILLSGMQRADGAVLAQFTTAIALGGLVSNTKAALGGYDTKEGAAFWEDAFDRAGVSGWLMEAQGLGNALTGGALSISGEKASRYQSRSAFQGLLGPSVDMMSGMYEATSAMARNEMTSRDARKLLRPIPGNNHPIAMIMGLTQSIADAMADKFHK